MSTSKNAVRKETVETVVKAQASDSPLAQPHLATPATDEISKFCQDKTNAAILDSLILSSKLTTGAKKTDSITFDQIRDKLFMMCDKSQNPGEVIETYFDILERAWRYQGFGYTVDGVNCRLCVSTVETVDGVSYALAADKTPSGSEKAIIGTKKYVVKPVVCHSVISRAKSAITTFVANTGGFVTGDGKLAAKSEMEKANAEKRRTPKAIASRGIKALSKASDDITTALDAGYKLSIEEQESIRAQMRTIAALLGQTVSFKAKAAS